MKTWILSIIILSLFSCRSNLNEKKTSVTGHLPTFKMISDDSTKLLSSADVPSGRPILFMYFSTSCDHCQRQVKSMLSHLPQMSDVQIYLITDDSLKEIKRFSKTFQLDTAKNIMVAKDLSYSFLTAYKPSDVPYIVIYNAQKELKKVYRGETDIDFILNTVRE